MISLHPSLEYMHVNFNYYKSSILESSASETLFLHSGHAF